MKKQTAVEWLKLQLETYGDPQYCELTWKELDELCEQAKAMENQAQSFLHQAQAQSLGYKAENLQAQTDKTNLDFVEQESGIAHQRAIETAMAQAQGNMQLKEQEHQQKLQEKILDHKLGLQNKTLDHVSALEQIKAKPKGNTK